MNELLLWFAERGGSLYLDHADTLTLVTHDASATVSLGMSTDYTFIRDNILPAIEQMKARNGTTEAK